MVVVVYNEYIMNIKNILNTKLIDNNSPAFLGFSHFIRSTLIFFVVGPVVFMFIFKLLNISSLFWFELIIYCISLFIGIFLSSLFIDKTSININKIIFISTFWFAILFFIFLLSNDSTIGFNQETLLPVIMIAEFYLVSKILLRKKISEK